MLNIKKMVAIMAISTGLGFGAQSINLNSSMSQANASSVWHNGTPKSMQGYWKYKIVPGTGGGGNWGNFSVWSNKMAEEDQGDPVLYMMDVEYQYKGNQTYLFKVFAKGNSIPSHSTTHIAGTRTGYMKVKILNNKKIDVISDTFIHGNLDRTWFRTNHAIITKGSFKYMND